MLRSLVALCLVFGVAAPCLAADPTEIKIGYLYLAPFITLVYYPIYKRLILCNAPKILGATKASQITENVKCLDLYPKLTPQIMKEIEKILDNSPNMPGPIPRSRAAMTFNKALL